MFVLPCPARIVPLVTTQLFVGCGDTAATLKFTNPPLHHNAGFAVMAPGVEGVPNKLIVRAVLLPGVQVFIFAVTDNCPLLNADPTCNRIVVLPCPLVIVVPAGLVHVYPVAPDMFAIEY
jgi:hypothetical protein